MYRPTRTCVHDSPLLSRATAAALRTTGNVYAYEALDELCFKPRNFKVRLTDRP